MQKKKKKDKSDFQSFYSSSVGIVSSLSNFVRMTYALSPRVAKSPAEAKANDPQKDILIDSR